MKKGFLVNFIPWTMKYKIYFSQLCHKPLPHDTTVIAHVFFPCHCQHLSNPSFISLILLFIKQTQFTPVFKYNIFIIIYLLTYLLHGAESFLRS